MSDRDRGRSHRDREVRDRDRDRDRDLDRDRHRDRDRDRERRRDDDDRDRKDRERSKRSRTPDRTRSRRRSHTRSRSPDRFGRRHNRTPSPDQSRKRHKRGDEDDKDRKKTAAVVSDFVDGIVKERKSQKGSSVDRGSAEPGAGGGGVEGEMDADEIEMMKMMGIPVGFDSTKGKHVPGTDLSGVKAVTKRQPRQYMNRRGGFNRPLPAETNR